MTNIQNKLFDNIFFTRISIKKIKSSRLNIELNKDNVKIYYIEKDQKEFTSYDDKYYIRFNYLKDNDKAEVINIKEVYNYFSNNLELLKQNKNNILVGYIKSIAWIYRYLKHNGINVCVLV